MLIDNQRTKFSVVFSEVENLVMKRKANSTDPSTALRYAQMKTC